MAWRGVAWRERRSVCIPAPCCAAAHGTSVVGVTNVAFRPLMVSAAAKSSDNSPPQRLTHSLALSAGLARALHALLCAGGYRQRLRENITRLVQIVDPRATDEDIAQAIENGTAHDLISRTLNRYVRRG